MPQCDPRLDLNCPSTSTSSGGGPYRPGDIFQTAADVHHYACTRPDCGRFWKFGPGTGLLEDPLRLAGGSLKSTH
jgi:hypothetical protein